MKVWRSLLLFVHVPFIKETFCNAILLPDVLRALLKAPMFSQSRAALSKQFQTTGPLNKTLSLPKSNFFLGTTINFPRHRDSVILTREESLLNIFFALNISCYFQSSLLSITTPRHLVVLVYSMIELPHLTGGKGPTRLCFCKIITSDLPLCKVNLFESHQPQISANSKFNFPTSSVLSPIRKAVVSSAYRCNSP